MKTHTFRRLLVAAVIAFPPALFAVDTDSDGLDDSVETNTGTYVSPTNTGTNPNNPDSDGDGAGDWYEVATIDVAPTATQPNAPNSAAIKPNVPYPLPAPDTSTGATNKPVKVYILSGQSNMVGQGNITPLGTLGTLETITKTDKKFPNLLNGTAWSVRKDVKYRGVIAALGNSDLTPGYNNGTATIGPEIGFGHVMGYHHDEPVLVLKASDGGKSLGGDFLPPGSVQYTYGANTYPGYGESPGSWATGSTPVPDPAFYGGIQFDKCFLRKADWAPAGAALPTVTNAATILDNFASEYPEWADQGFEIAGFAWFHGWNDGLSYTAFYANRYKQNMAQFIRQIRAYYASRYPGKIKPNAPFVIATAAFEGWNEAYLNQYPTRRAVLDAQLGVGTDPVNYPDLVGNVKTMEARGFWRDKSVSPVPGGSQGYHYNRHAETFMLVGDALGRGMIDLLAASGPDTTPPVVSGLNPADNATGAAPGANLVITFNETIAIGNGNITLKNLTDATESTIAVTDAGQVSASGAFLTINPTADLTGGKSYAIRIDAGAVKDLSENAFAGIADDTTWNFTTTAPDLTPPAISSISPADNATGVASGANLILTFNEPVVLGTGMITIKNLTNSTQTVIALTDATQVSLSGAVLTINPTTNLAATSSHAIRIDAGAVKDLSNNPLAGIADDTTWNFTTAAPPVNGEITIVNQVEGFLGSTKTQVTTTHNGTTQVSYDAAGIDKLVVVFATESGFNSTTTTEMTMSFNGVAMTLGKFQQTFPNPVSNDNGAVAIFYLDDPFQGAANFTAGVTNTGGGPNGGHVSIIGLTGTQNGIGAVAGTSHTDVVNGNSVGTSIATTGAKSLVIAGIEASGSNNVTGSFPTAVTPMTLSNNGGWGNGNAWGHGASGYQSVPDSGTTITPTFFSGTSKYVDVAAVEFLAAELASSAYDTWAGGPFFGILTNPDPSLDFDRGGLPNAIEWVVGGDPTQGDDDASLAPSIDSTSDPDGMFLFTYRRRDAANTDPNTTIAVEYGTNLTGWNTATHNVNGVTIDDTAVPEAGFRTVVVTIPKALAGPDGKLFARLNVVVNTP